MPTYSLSLDTILGVVWIITLLRLISSSKEVLSPWYQLEYVQISLGCPSYRLDLVGQFHIHMRSTPATRHQGGLPSSLDAVWDGKCLRLIISRRFRSRFGTIPSSTEPVRVSGLVKLIGYYGVGWRSRGPIGTGGWKGVNSYVWNTNVPPQGLPRYHPYQWTNPRASSAVLSVVSPATGTLGQAFESGFAALKFPTKCTGFPSILVCFAWSRIVVTWGSSVDCKWLNSRKLNKQFNTFTWGFHLFIYLLKFFSLIEPT